jgi:beta-alanine degradation protein BauB
LDRGAVPQTAGKLRVMNLRFGAGLIASMIVAAPAVMRGQRPEVDPVAVSPDKYKVLLDNESARVVEYSINPGERDSSHTHPAKVSYVLSGGTLRISVDGSSFLSEEKRGEVIWRGSVPRHFAENTGTTPVRIVLFEVKRVEFSRVAPDKDPALVNPASISVRLENDSVRVMEADLPPGFQEKVHAHTPYVMYILNGGRVRIHGEDGSSREAELKPGDVFFSDPVTHWAENIGSSTVKILLVEIRRR